MAVSEKLLEILVCPETKQKVSVASVEVIQQVNERIRQGEQRNSSGNLVEHEIDGGLIRDDKQVLYPVREDIPIMLIDEQLLLSE